MDLNQRQFKIVSMLLSEKRFVSSSELAKIFYVTDRTIKNDYKIITMFFEKQNIQYELKTRQGIKVTSDNVEEISNALLKEYNFGNYRTEYHQRAFVLLRQIVNKIGWFSIESLANEMNFSRSVIADVLPEIRFRLSRYGLTIKKRTHYGMMVQGKEINIRCAIIDTFDVANSDISSAHYVDELRDTSLYNIVEIKSVLKELFIQFNIESQEVLIDKIVLAIIISSIRSKYGAFIQEDLKEIENSGMKQIITNLSNRLNLQLSKPDILFISLYALHFASPKNKEDYGFYYGDLMRESNRLLSNMTNYLHNELNYQEHCEVVLDELQKFTTKCAISNAYGINAIFFSRDISLWTEKVPGTIDFVYRIFEDLNLRLGNECSRYLLYYAVFIVETIIRLKKESKFFKEIVIVSNFDTIVAYRYYNEIAKFFKDVLPVRIGKYEANNQSLYIVVDDKKIIGSNIIHVVYETETGFLFDSISNLIDLYNYRDILLEYEEVRYKNDVNNIQELFDIVARYFNESSKKINETKEYLERRHMARSIDFGNAKYVFIILFDQEKKGFKKIVFNNLVNIRNRFIKEILVFSIDKANLEEYMKVVKIQKNLLKLK